MSNQDKPPVRTYADRLKEDLKKPRPMPADMPQELREWWDLGEAGKLWSLEFTFTLGGLPEVHRRLLRNLTEPKLTATRAKMFIEGLTLRKEPGHWVIVCPMDIIAVDVYQQFGYFSG